MMKLAPDCVIINATNPHGGDTYIARAKGGIAAASSTNSRQAAVERCADKIYGAGGYQLRQITPETWIASRAPL